MENSKASLDVLGVPEEMQAAMIAATSTTITEKISDTEWKETEEMSDWGSHTSTINFGVKKEEKLDNGDTYTTFIEWDGEKVVGVMEFPTKGVTATVSRTVDGDTQYMYMTVGDQTSIQTNKRV